MINKDFLKSVLNGEKQLLKLKDVKFVNPPSYDEISVKNLYPRFSQDQDFMRYMPSQLPKGKYPTKSYFFNVANTLFEDRVQAMIENANKVRFEASRSGILQEEIVVTEEMWAKLNLMPFYSCKSDPGLIFCV